MKITIPKPGRGRRSPDAEIKHQRQIEEFCSAILDINSRLDFRVSGRGWYYVLEEHGRELCRNAITKYVDADAPQKYLRECQDCQREINARVLERLGEDES